MFMATSKLTLQNCLRDISDLAEAVESANNNLCSRNEAEMFVTSWIGVLDIPTGHLEFVCAGHNPPALITEQGAEFIRTKPCFVLAGMDGIKYRKESLDLNHGDKLFMYTDGVNEAMNEANEEYGDDRMMAFLGTQKGQGCRAIIDNQLADIKAFVGNAPQSDDITMLTLTRKA